MSSYPLLPNKKILHFPRLLSKKTPKIPPSPEISQNSIISTLNNANSGEKPPLPAVDIAPALLIDGSFGYRSSGDVSSKYLKSVRKR